MNQEITLLIVDDEQNILNSLNRLLFSEPFDILLANSGQEALQILEEEQVDILISDYKMPGMNGGTLLKAVRERYPDIFRIILSGYIEIDTIHHLLSDGTALMYFTKPWHEYNFTEQLQRVIKTYQQLKSKELLSFFQTVDALPGISDTYTAVSAAIERQCAIPEVAKLVKTDIALVAKILQISNSVFYGTHENTSIETAITKIGLTSLKDIILIHQLTISKNITSAQEEWIRYFLNRSMILVKGMEKLNHDSKIPINQSLVSPLGLLSSLGIIIILIYRPEQFENTITTFKNTTPSLFYESEISAGYEGQTHAEIGGYYLMMHNFPYSLVESILFHHEPEKILSKNHIAAKLLYLTCLLFSHIETGSNIEERTLPGWYEELATLEQIIETKDHMEAFYDTSNR